MIQRVQSLWLLAAALCAALTYKFPFYSGNKIGEANMQEFKKLVASSNFLLLIFSGALAAGCLIIIFLYKDRKQQLWLTIAAFAISVIDLFIYFSETKKFVSGTYSLSAVLAFAIPVFLLLAARGIRSDEKLVKSLDRLR
jgi:glucan phosphoethanolaminetransferase (alkaline phosphatase superfamily)